MPRQIATRDDAVERITEVFRSYGYDGASLARLQAATGLKSSSLYNYFPGGKEDMAAAALGLLLSQMERRALQALQGPGPPAQRVSAFSTAMDELYRSGESACLLNLFGIGDAHAKFAGDLNALMRKLVRGLAATAEEAGVSPAEAARRAEDAMIALEGALVVSRALGTPAPWRRVISELPSRLAA